MRLFTGIGLPEHVEGDMARLLDSLRSAAHLKWSPSYNLHITTKFIGEWPETEVNSLIEGLSRLESRKNIDISISGIGWFPNSQAPRILFAGVHAGPELARLAADTNNVLAEIGIERETKRFSPHLTLARVRDPGVSLAPLRSAMEKLDPADFSRFTATGFKLYLSAPGPAGSIYTQLAEFPFTTE